MRRKRRRHERKFAFITCVNDEVQYQECVKHIDALGIPPGFSLEKISIRGASSIARAYDRAMRMSDAEVKVYLHQDTFIKNQNFLADTYEVLQLDPAIGMVGVVGARRLPASGIWFARNWRQCYGKLYECRRGGVLHSILGRFNKRKERLIRFRRVREPYMPVVVIDGLIMVTRHDLRWRQDLCEGFVYYEAPHCGEFLRHGYKVVLAGQQQPWVMHYGPREERGVVGQAQMDKILARSAEKFRAEYPELIEADVEHLLARYVGNTK